MRSTVMALILGWARLFALVLLAVAVAWLVRQVAWGLVSITLELFFFPTSARAALEPFGIKFVGGPMGTIAIAALGMPGLMLAPQKELGRAFFRSQVGAIASLAVVTVLSASYRFMGLVACVVWLTLLWRRAGKRMVWCAGALVVALSVLPVDVSLRMRPGPPRVVRTVSGDWGIDAIQRDGRGEVAIVGTNDQPFFEGGWVVVW